MTGHPVGVSESFLSGESVLNGLHQDGLVGSRLPSGLWYTLSWLFLSEGRTQPLPVGWAAQVDQ